MKYLKPINISATTLPDAWFQTLYKCVDTARAFTIDHGSFSDQKRLEFDFVTIHVTQPEVLPLLPKVNPQLGFPDPVAEGYLDDYLPYLMTGEEKAGEAYTYGQRLCKESVTHLLNEMDASFIIPEMWGDFPDSLVSRPRGIPGILHDGYDFFLSQTDLMIWTYKNKGHRNNQMVMQVGKPSDMCLVDPPCLRHIDTRIQDGKLHFFPYFRSWDLFGGFPANLAAIELLKQHCASEIGVGNGEIIATSKGLHLYDYVFQIAEALRGRSIGDFQDMTA